MRTSPVPRDILGIAMVLCALAALVMPGARPAHAQGPVRIMFLHHSTGHNLIEEGGVREGLTTLGYEFYDHGYNDDGLRLADGSYTGTHFDVPGDNTDPDGFAAIFAQPLHDPPDNTFSHLMQYDVIAFKSCFPTSNIYDDAQLADYQSYYLSIRDRMDQYPDKIFVVVTPPPQVPADTNPTEAGRARAFANWLISDEYLAGHPNVFTFDFFDLLAGDDNFLRREYRTVRHDAHPNQTANSTIGPQFVSFIDEAIHSYDLGQPRPAAEPVEAIEEAATGEEAVAQPEPAAVPAAAAGLIDSFESTTEPWSASSEGPTSVVECGGDTGFAHSGGASLRIHYEISPDGWVDCGQFFEDPQNWSGGTGLSMWLMADTPGQGITLMVFSGDIDNPTPFETHFETTADSVRNWTQVAFSWADFARAGWADEGGLSVIDPAQVTGYGFSLGAGGAPSEGIARLDDIALLTGGEQPPPGDAVSAGEPDEEPAGGGSLCPLAIVLPLGALSVVIASRRRK